MRRVRNYRNLQADEIGLAKTVFKGTIPYDKVLVSDGLGYNDRPFTVPTDIPWWVATVPALAFLITAGFGIDSDEGDFVMHVGNGYNGLAKTGYKPTLIHEMVHVWQGYHSPGGYVLEALKDQILVGEDAYKYYRGSSYSTSDTLEYWQEYGPEQQAQIIEDWFVDGLIKTPSRLNDSEDEDDEKYDKRFWYVKTNIRGEKMDKDWIKEQFHVKPLPTSTLRVAPYYAPWKEEYVLPLLAKRFRADDMKGEMGRIRDLEGRFQEFHRWGASESSQYADRLLARKKGDKAAQYFHDNLSTDTRNKLIKALRAG